MNRLKVSSLEELGTALKDLRKAQNLRITQVKDISGVSISTISMVEMGKQYPRFNTLVEHAKALGVDEIVIEVK